MAPDTPTPASKTDVVYTEAPRRGKSRAAANRGHFAKTRAKNRTRDRIARASRRGNR